jgi:hypothetical protein
MCRAPFVAGGKTKQEFVPFENVVRRVRADPALRWEHIEGPFLVAVEAFDAEYAAGARTQGWYQAKARYFNDVIVNLLANRAGKHVSMRVKKLSRLFDKLDVDICFPEDDPPRIAGEVKALGTPPHPKNRNKARPASQDLHKRVREVAFTSMDLKAAYSPPKPISSFQHWIDSTEPGYFCFWAIRANDDADLEKARSTLSSLRAYCNRVGAFVYRPRKPETPTAYEVVPLKELSVEQTIHEMAQRIIG